MSFADIFLIVASVCSIAVCLQQLIKISVEEENTAEAAEESWEDYSSKVGDIDYQTIEEKSSLSPIGNEETYIIKEKDGQFFVKLLKDYAVYDPTIHTIGKQVEEKIIPTCYLFKYRKKGEDLWRRVYIIVVSPQGIDCEFKIE